MTDKPITIPTIRIPALREGRMTQMLVPIDPQPKTANFCGILLDENLALFDHGLGYVTIRDSEKIPLPYSIGDRLWVRETWNQFFADELDPERETPIFGRMGIPAQPERRSVVAYRSDGDVADHPKYGKAMWRSSVTMPRWASRTTLVVNDVRVQRVQEISEADAIAEGCIGFVSPDGNDGESPREQLQDLWNTLHGPDAWDRNDWVCAISSDVHRCNIDQMPGDV